MAAVVTILGKSAGQRTISIYGTVALSGTYATGGEPLAASSLRPGTTKKPHIINVVGKSGFDYQYDVETEKLKVNSAGVEATAGAYAAGVIADVIRFEAVFPKFG